MAMQPPPPPSSQGFTALLRVQQILRRGNKRGQEQIDIQSRSGQDIFLSVHIVVFSGKFAASPKPWYSAVHSLGSIHIVGVKLWPL